MMTARTAFRAAAATVGVLLLSSAPAAGQSTLERTPLLGDDWVGFPWDADFSVHSAFDDRAAGGIDADPAFQMALGLPFPGLLGVRFTPEPRANGDAGPTTLEGFARVRLAEQDRGAPVDLALEALAVHADDDWNAVARAHAGRWLGPLRLMGRASLVSPLPAVTAGAGAVWHPLPGRAPIALAGDISTVVFNTEEYLDIVGDPSDDRPITWSAGLQVGLSFTTHTLSVFATNAPTTLHGQLSAHDDVRLGLELTAPVPAGRFFGAHVPRETAMDAVAPVEEPEAAGAEVVTIPIREYRYAPQRLVVERGTVIEWVNEDDVMHTATADDAAWNSGAIPPGQRWSASFDEPGTYPYHCGPHPFMRGVIVVR